MADLTTALLNRLGFNLPTAPAPDPSVQAANDQAAEQSQAQDPMWKQAVNQGIGGLVGLFKGATGLGDQGPAGPTWTNAGQVLAAGMPFAGYASKGINEVYHGSPNLFSKFDPSRYDTQDVLGWMTHAAEDPNYARGYAIGTMKHRSGGGQPNITVLQPQAKNVLDLVDPNIDDLAQAMAPLPDYAKRDLISRFKAVRRQIRENPDPSNLRELAEYHMDDRHIKGRLDPAEIPAKVLAEHLRLGPEEFAKTPFDAIRYNDMDKESWAIPAGTPITAIGRTHLASPPVGVKVRKAEMGYFEPFSEPKLMQDPKPTIPVIKNDKSGGGSLMVNKPQYAWKAPAKPIDYNFPLSEIDPHLLSTYKLTAAGQEDFALHDAGKLSTQDLVNNAQGFKENVLGGFLKTPQGQAVGKDYLVGKIDLEDYIKQAESWSLKGSKPNPAGMKAEPTISPEDLYKELTKPGSDPYANPSLDTPKHIPSEDDYKKAAIAASSNKWGTPHIDQLFDYHSKNPSSVSYVIKSLGSTPQEFLKNLGVHMLDFAGKYPPEPDITDIAKALNEGKIKPELVDALGKEFLPQYYKKHASPSAWIKWISGLQ